MTRLPRPPREARLLALGAVAIAAGAVLRLAWPEDVHYLGDEAWTFAHVMEAKRGGPWATLGMPSSAGLKNAGMSVWVFIVLGIASGASTPAGLTRAVAMLALLAHALAFVIPLTFLGAAPGAKDDRVARDRLAWTWAVILSMTNPMLVFLERKIWAQSVLPIFMVAFFVAWLRRETRAAAFIWGLVGALMGQIHMAAFFFVPAVAAWTKLFADKTGPRARWIPWLLGSTVGAAPAIPWLLYLARDRPPSTPSPWWLRFRLEFYQYFFSDPTGLTGEYVLGKDIVRAMKYPIVAGTPTYLVALAHVVLAVASIAIARRAIAHLWSRRHEWRDVLRGNGTETGVLLSATLVGMGALMTLPSISIHRHYMLALFPLPYVWAARAALRKPGGERWLAMLFGGCFIVSAGLLSFVHDTAENDEMGKTYRTQIREGIAPENAKPKRASGPPSHPTSETR